MKKITVAALAAVGNEGSEAVGQLTTKHKQDGCTEVGAGARFLIKGRREGMYVGLFPHDAIDESPVFSDGHIRIVPRNGFKVVGRYG